MYMAGGRRDRQRDDSSRGRATQEEEEVEVEVDKSVEEETEEEEASPGIPITYTEDDKIILDIKGLWFKHKYVVRGVTASTQQKMTRGVTCWSKASKEDKEDWFNNFRVNKNKGKIRTASELFYDTHTKEGVKGKRVFTSKKDRDLYNHFKVRKEKNPEMLDNEIWLDLVEGFYKGAVYGTGTARELFYDTPMTRAPSSQNQTYVPGIVSQLQTSLEAE